MNSIMHVWSRRDLLGAGVLVSSGVASAFRVDEAGGPNDVHQQLLGLAARQEERRRARFASVRTRSDLEALQRDLRETFLHLIGGLPERTDAPPARTTGTIDGGDFLIEKLVFESLPGYFVPALLYRPKTIDSPLPAVLSPCGHSTVGKAEGTYQILHLNLVKRGYVVLTYDPVGQGERSQFWDTEKRRSRFNLSCGEHAVLGNPLYLIGSSLARYRIWDGMRGLDYLANRPEVDAKRMGCVGNSGGGTLTAYISALDPRVSATAICCYITTLPRRMGNRIQEDPSADPEQDIFGFVSEGIDHAGLLALLAPRPTLLGTARFDFFPIEGARESFAEAKRLFGVAGAGDRIDRAEAAERHGLTKPLRLAVYAWFDRWLTGGREPKPAQEVAFTPRAFQELLVSRDGQVNRSFQSRPLLPLALKEFDRRGKWPRARLREVLRLDPEQAGPQITRAGGENGQGKTLVLCVNGNEARDWREEAGFLHALGDRGYSVLVIDPRGAGQSRSRLRTRWSDYADPISGVEENIAYNAFLVGKSLLGMRVTDVIVAVNRLGVQEQPRRIVVCGRRDGALVAALAAAVEPAITHLATEQLLLSFRSLFVDRGVPINAASILPGLLERFGDMPDILAQVAPRKVLITAGCGESPRTLASVRTERAAFSSKPRMLIDWLES
jgi:cephalosporin-C deacetylase-like acetyl esterase